MWKRIAVGTALIALTIMAVWQATTIRELRTQGAGTRTGSMPGTEAPDATPPRVALRNARDTSTRAVVVNDAQMDERVATLEKQVALLTQNAEYLMARGQLPLAAHKIAELEQKFMDPNASERDRMQALRLLRRNGALSDAVVQHTLSWLQTATNNGLREDLIQQLAGSTNLLVRDPMIKLASSDPDADVRERAVQSLRRFLGSDPQVE